jgi:hypothetical protein
MDDLGILIDLYGTVVPDVRELYRRDKLELDRRQYSTFTVIDVMKERRRRTEFPAAEVMLQRTYDSIPMDSDVVSTVERLVDAGVPVSITVGAGSAFEATAERIRRHPVFASLPFVPRERWSGEGSVFVTADLDEAKAATRAGHRAILFITPDRLTRELALQGFL